MKKEITSNKSTHSLMSKKTVRFTAASMLVSIASLIGASGPASAFYPPDPGGLGGGMYGDIMGPPSANTGGK